MHHLKFTDKRVVLSVFEANIRMVGGLLSAHLLVEDDPTLLPQYAGQFLVCPSFILQAFSLFYFSLFTFKSLARELGQELLHAFKTVDGIPHKRVSASRIRFLVTNGFCYSRFTLVPQTNPNILLSPVLQTQGPSC